MTYDAYDVVVVPFPFTDRSTSKRRPALVLSNPEVFNNRVGQSVLAMITTAKNSSWPLDTEITDLDSAGLPSPSVVRMKLFTLDHKFIVRKVGSLVKRDKASVKIAVHSLLNL